MLQVNDKPPLSDLLNGFIPLKIVIITNVKYDGFMSNHTK